MTETKQKKRFTRRAQKVLDALVKTLRASDSSGSFSAAEGLWRGKYTPAVICEFTDGRRWIINLSHNLKNVRVLEIRGLNIKEIHQGLTRDFEGVFES